MITVGTRIYGLGALALGLVGLAWGNFALMWQPVPAAVPGRTILAYLFAAALVLGGLALNARRTAAAGAATLSILFGLATLLHARHVLHHPQVFGAWSGLAEQLALTVAGLIVYAGLSAGGQRAAPGMRLEQRIFGLCLLVFGLAHFFYLEDTAAMVPAWLTPGQLFWAAATGVAHIAAGIAILTGFKARLAAIALTVMFALFGILVHAPLLLGDPRSHLLWVMNTMNLALIGAAWVLADSFAPGLAAGRGGVPLRRPA